MQNFLHRWRHLGFVLSASLLMDLALPGLAFPGDGDLIQNLRFEAQGRVVHLFYDLNGDPNELYRVKILMKRGGDPDYEYKPVNVTGDVGDNISQGSHKHITWNTTDEFPNGLPGNDYYFTADAESMSGNLTQTLEIVGGGVVAAGLLGYLIFKKSPSTPPPPTPTDFPAPPARP